MNEERKRYDLPDEDSKQDFKSIRKNLLLISLIIIIFQLGDVNIKKFSILGTSLEFNSPRIIPYALYVLFGFYLLRYFQYSMKVGRRMYRESLHMYIDEEMEGYIEERFNVGTDRVRMNKGLDLEAKRTIPKYSDFKFRYDGQYHIEFVRVYYDQEGRHETNAGRFKIDFDLTRMKRIARRCHLRFILLYPDRLDFILPYIIAVLAIASYWISF